MIHTPVLVDEVLAIFQPDDSDSLLDATAGTGGHLKAYLNAGGPDSTAVAMDADDTALQQARKNLAPFGNRVTYVHTNFTNAQDSIAGGGILPSSDEKPPQFTHILFDLGIGSHQLADPARGFSFTSSAPPRMAFGHLTNLPAAKLNEINVLAQRLGRNPDVPELIQHLPAHQLAAVIRTYGEERFANRIAAALKANQPFASAVKLAKAITDGIPDRYRRQRIHPATRTFLALRLAVNRELEVLEEAIPRACDLLKPNGILAVISFHSLEDRIVKHSFRTRAAGTSFHLLTKKPVVAGKQEVQANPRARSAKLRAIKRIE